MKGKYYILILIATLQAVYGFAQGLIIPSGAYVTANNGNIVVYKNWVNNGTFTHTGGTLIFAGITQTLGGSSAAVFNNITIASPSNTTITSPQSVKAIILCNDTLNAGGNLTLKSTATQTALIDGSGSGQVLGNVTMQRYLDSSYGYRYISSPFQAATVAGLSSYINLSASFPRFYSYDENVDHAGWVIDTTGTNILSPLKGYTGNFGTSTSPVTASLIGVVNNGTLSTTLYNHNKTYTLGYNLVSNPYPSPINWTASSGWTKTNIDNAIYYFNHGDTNQYYGRYSSYIAGVSSDGVASNIIPAMQGFFVHVSNGSYPVTGTLACTNAVRITNLSPRYHKPTVSGDRPLLRLDAGFSNDGNHSDPTVIYFEDLASNNFDHDFDALKLMNTEPGIPSLYSVSQDDNNLSIQSIPVHSDSLILIPLGLRTEKDGLVTFNALNIENISQGMHLWFYDTKTGQCQDLKEIPKYQVQLAVGVYEHRFFLSFTDKDKVVIPGVDGELNAYVSGSNLFVYVTSGKGKLMVTNMLGQVVATEELVGNGYHEIPLRVSSGIYVATLYSDMGKQSKKIFIGN